MRLWDQVDIQGDGDCWMWDGKTTRDGYGQIRVGPKMVGAHRLAYLLEVGNIPEGAWVLHHCDTPLCVSPAHLFIGTNADNVADRQQKGRSSGGGAWNAKLTIPQVRKAIRRLLNGESKYTIARDLGVARETINSLWKKRLWRQVWKEMEVMANEGA
jgi:hypothetical protein